MIAPPPLLSKISFTSLFSRSLAITSPPPSPFLIARIRNVFALTSLYALSYVIMQFVERSIVTSWLRFDQKVRKFEHSLNRGGAEVFIEEEKNFIDFYSLR